LPPASPKKLFQVLVFDLPRGGDEHPRSVKLGKVNDRSIPRREIELMRLQQGICRRQELKIEGIGVMTYYL